MKYTTGSFFLRFAELYSLRMMEHVYVYRYVSMDICMWVMYNMCVYQS
jgi:hypothetical protein